MCNSDIRTGKIRGIILIVMFLFLFILYSLLCPQEIHAEEAALHTVHIYLYNYGEPEKGQVVITETMPLWSTPVDMAAYANLLADQYKDLLKDQYVYGFSAVYNTEKDQLIFDVDCVDQNKGTYTLRDKTEYYLRGNDIFNIYLYPEKMELPIYYCQYPADNKESKGNSEKGKTEIVNFPGKKMMIKQMKGKALSIGTGKADITIESQVDNKRLLKCVIGEKAESTDSANSYKMKEIKTIYDTALKEEEKKGSKHYLKHTAYGLEVSEQEDTTNSEVIPGNLAIYMIYENSEKAPSTEKKEFSEEILKVISRHLPIVIVGFTVFVLLISLYVLRKKR